MNSSSSNDRVVGQMNLNGSLSGRKLKEASRVFGMSYRQRDEDRMQQHLAECERLHPSLNDQYQQCCDAYELDGGHRAASKTTRKTKKQLEAMTVVQLKQMVRVKGLPGYSRMCKAELVALVIKSRSSRR